MEKKPFTPVIETERLVLKQRKLTLETAKEMSDLILRNKDFLGEWMPWAHRPNTPQDCYESSLRSQKKWEDMQTADYLIYDKNNNFMGSVSMKDIDYTANSGEIGYWLGKEFGGKGYVTEAVKALENEFFQRGLEKVYIKTDYLNISSSNVAMRCGYKREKLLRYHEWNTTSSERRDTQIFSKLRKDWGGR